MYGLPLLHLLGLFCRWQCSGKRCIFGFGGFSLCLSLIMLYGSEYYHVGGRHRLDEYAINWGSKTSTAHHHGTGEWGGLKECAVISKTQTHALICCQESGRDSRG